MEKINITFFVSTLDSGGLENYLLRFIRYKHKEFNKIYICCKNGKGGLLEEEFIKFPEVEIIKTKYGYFDIYSYKYLKTFFIKNRIHTVCDFTGNFSGRVLHVAKNVGVKQRVAFYRSAADSFKSNLLKQLYVKWINLLVLKNSTYILSNSKSAFDFFYPKGWKSDKRFSVVDNGINPMDFISISKNLRTELGLPKNAYVIGHTGRYNEAKNHSTILKVAKILINKYSDVFFILCGSGVKLNLSKEIKKLDLIGRVFLFENRKDIPQFLNTMDCYFFPSTREGQPNALIEAMIMGLPFIASNIAPIIETVDSKYKLYDPFDIELLVDALEKKYLERPERDFLLQKIAMKRFDFRVRFDEFYEFLI